MTCRQSCRVSWVIMLEITTRVQSPFTAVSLTFSPLFPFPSVARPFSFLRLPHSLPLSHLSPLCLRPVLKCDAVSRCKQSSVTGACNSRMVAILAWTLTVVAVTSDGEGGADRRWQADEEEEEDRYSSVPSKCTLTTASL